MVLRKILMTTAHEKVLMNHMRCFHVVWARQTISKAMGSRDNYNQFFIGFIAV